MSWLIIQRHIIAAETKEEAWKIFIEREAMGLFEIKDAGAYGFSIHQLKEVPSQLTDLEVENGCPE